MNLAQIYEKEGRAGLNRLAERVCCSSEYLWQLAVGFQGRRPSGSLAVRLVDADPRLTLDALLRRRPRRGDLDRERARAAPDGNALPCAE